MRWASFVSEEPALEVAIQQAAERIRDQLGGTDPDLVLIFVSAHHADDYPEAPRELRQEFPNATVIGCSGGGVVGGGREVEHSPAVSLTAAVLPGVTVTSFHVGTDDTEALVERPEAWREILELNPAQPVHFILLAEPYSCDARELLDSLDAAFPASGKIGGLASAAQEPGDNALFIDDEAYPDGAVGVVLNGALDMDTIVAQGCRPVGPPLFVTRVVGNRILELDGDRPTHVLADIYEELGEEDQRLFRHSLSVGVVMAEGLEEYVHGDFLIRNIVGLDAETGVLAIGESLRPGQVLQLHVRDARTSADDLHEMLARYKERGERMPDVALLFSCMGRGEVLYGEPDHDSRLISEQLGPLPIGGFFCSGEIGPVNQRTFLHGFTSSIALFRSRAGEPE